LCCSQVDKLPDRGYVKEVRREAIAHNSVVFFKEALDEARLKDKELRSTGRAEGAFWGLPSSFKGTYDLDYSGVIGGD
jgi:hypothetical protein